MAIASEPASNPAEALLDVIGKLAEELHPGLGLPISLDSHLDRDIGLDSLARVELLSRLEGSFAVRLDEQALLRAETPRDILAALLTSGGVPRPPIRAEHPPAATAIAEVEAPAQAETLADVLAWHARLHPERRHLILLDEADRSITYRELWDGALLVASGLRSRGIEPGLPIGLMLPTGQDYFFGFFGILLAGAIPVPLYPPFRPSQLAEHLERQSGILSNAGTPFMVASSEERAFATALQARVSTLQGILTSEDFRAAAPLAPAAVKATDTALLQYTSGSTGRPKGVVLSHANLLANIRAMGQVVGASSKDVFVSWLPLYHDMGLIGAWLGSLYYGAPLAVMAPLSFLARPERWLWAIHRHHGTLSAAPNFAFDLCVRRVDEANLVGLDLKSLRLLLNGSEPVSPDTIARFSERFNSHGLRPPALTPVYGLAESSVGLCFSQPGRGPRVESVDRDRFMRTSRAEPSSASTLRFVSCGLPLPGHQVRIVDAHGQELPDREVGRLEFRGPSATSGYFRNPVETAKLFDGEWLDSGDLAYRADGEIYLTGRVKDLIIRAGRNIVPQELEEAIGTLPGIRSGCVAAFASPDPVAGTERLIVVAETRAVLPVERQELLQRIQARTVDLLGLVPDDIVLAEPHGVPKTSSGKLQRGACRERYERGDYRQLPSWQGRLRHGISKLVSWNARLVGKLSDFAYSAYAWTVFEILAAWALPAALLAKDVATRRARMRAAGRVLVRCLGLRVEVRGALPRGRPFVLVANHASYLDALALEATLAPDALYVATRQLLDQPIPRLVLPKLGVLFVDPSDPGRAQEDSRALLRVAEEGRAIVIFPEGGIDRRPGLRPFHLGAFLTAARANLPVVPVAISGTRWILPPFTWFPRPGSVQITIGSPIETRGKAPGGPSVGQEPPPGEVWSTAIALRNAALSDIAKHCGEGRIERY